MNVKSMAVVVTLKRTDNKYVLTYVPVHFNQVEQLEHFDQLFPEGWTGWGIATEEEIKQGKALTEG
jgi:hypothetical protein